MEPVNKPSSGCHSTDSLSFNLRLTLLVCLSLVSSSLVEVVACAILSVILFVTVASIIELKQTGKACEINRAYFSNLLSKPWTGHSVLSTTIMAIVFAVVLLLVGFIFYVLSTLV